MPKETKFEIKFVGTVSEFAEYQTALRENHTRLEEYRARRRMFDNLCREGKAQVAECVRDYMNEARRASSQASRRLDAFIYLYWSVDIAQRSRLFPIEHIDARISILQELKRF